MFAVILLLRFYGNLSEDPVFAAIQEQLGLKRESQQAIESIEKPLEN